LLLLSLLLIKADDDFNYEDFDNWDNDDLQEWLKEKRVASRIIKEIDDWALDGEGLLVEARNDFSQLDLHEDDQHDLLRLLCRYVKEFCELRADDTSNTKKKGDKKVIKGKNTCMCQDDIK